MLLSHIKSDDSGRARFVNNGESYSSHSTLSLEGILPRWGFRFPTAIQSLQPSSRDRCEVDAVECGGCLVRPICTYTKVTHKFRHLVDFSTKYSNRHFTVLSYVLLYGVNSIINHLFSLSSQNIPNTSTYIRTFIRYLHGFFERRWGDNE